jgi:hypothetical protein
MEDRPVHSQQGGIFQSLMEVTMAAVAGASALGAGMAIADQEGTSAAKTAVNADNAKNKMKKAGEDNALQYI